MPRTQLQFQQMKDERKLSILESSLPLFAIHTVDTVSIDMICQKAKCSHGLAYHYFKNVEQIYDELLKSKTYKNLFSSLNVIDLNKEAYPQIEELVKKLISIIKQSKTEVAFALIIVNDESKKSLYSSFVKLVDAGQKEGSVTAGKPEDIVSTFYLLIKGLYQTILNQKHPAIRVPSIDNILKIFKRY